MSLAPGTRLGAYEVVGLIGAGGMGEVYRAHHAKLSRDVAIKILPAAVSRDADHIARFEREARAVAALSHPNILAIHDFGSDHGVHYAVTELLEGQTLRDLLRHGPPPLAKSLAITTQLTRGLEAAHTRGIVHRDLKPENVFVLNDGQIKILDFGLAKAVAADSGSATTAEILPGGTGAGVVLGTAGYMSPEQVRGEAVDHRTDIFSLGCIVYELLAGCRAFAGDSAIDTMHATLHQDPAGLDAPGGVPGLSRVVRRCLEKNVSERFQNAADLRFALETVSDVAPPRPAPAEARPVRRVSMRSAAIAAALVVAVLAGAWYWRAPRATASPSPFAIDQAHGLAVLPFQNLGGTDEDYFAAGITEEITQQLSKIASMRIVSRAAIAAFKDPTAQLAEMARDLDIGAVLTGTVRHAGPQVRVSVQLLGAPGGELLWSDQFDRTVENLFDVQSEIAVRVTREMSVALTPEELARIERPPTRHVEAWELLLRTRTLSFGDDGEQNDKAIEMLRRAVALDPAFAAGLAALSHRLTFRGDRAGRATYLEAVQVGRAAVAADPLHPTAHYALGLALEASGQTDEARASLRLAIELNPNFAAAFNDMSYLEINAGRPDEALAWAKRAFRLAPNLANSYYHVAAPVAYLDDQAAERFLLAAARRFPVTDGVGGYRIRMQLAYLDITRGHFAAGEQRLREVLAANPGVDSLERFLTEAATYANAPDAAPRLDTAVQRAPDARSFWLAPHTPRTLRAYLLLRDGRRDAARPLIDAALANNRRAIDDGDRLSYPRYENAALHLMRGDRGAALNAFDDAIAAGYWDARFPAVDPLLADLRGDPRFVSGVARIAARVAEMRKRVDLSDLERWSGTYRD